MVQDTYRKHPRPSAFDKVRDEVVRLVSGRLADKSPNAIYESTGIKMSRQDKYEWVEGDLRGLSDNRLFLLAEKLGLRLDIQVAVA